MTIQAIQVGNVQTNDFTSQLSRRVAVFGFCGFAVVVASFWLATANSQEPSSVQSATIEPKALDGLDSEEAAQSVAPSDSAVQPEVSDVPVNSWRPLLDEQLSLWEVFTGVPHRSITIEGFPKSKSGDCRKGKPFGLGDPKNVYSVAMVDGVPVLHVSGEMYAGLTSLEEFENYHFSTEFKWGEKKWPPRLKVKRDSGILFHCIGKHGAFWNVWMRCFQCQVQEGDCGDFIPLAGTSCQVKVTPETEGDTTPQHSFKGNWRTIGPGVRKWGAKRFGNYEIEGDWNRIEIHTLNDKSVFSVNGHPVMHLKNTRVGKFKKAKALTRGKIQVQSEAAECWYRDMKIRIIDKLPVKLAEHFED